MRFIRRDGAYNPVTDVLKLSKSKRFGRGCKPRPALKYEVGAIKHVGLRYR